VRVVACWICVASRNEAIQPPTRDRLAPVNCFTSAPLSITSQLPEAQGCARQQSHRLRIAKFTPSVPLCAPSLVQSNTVCDHSAPCHRLKTPNKRFPPLCGWFFYGLQYSFYCVS
jgi:hypothetical protein